MLLSTNHAGDETVGSLVMESVFAYLDGGSISLLVAAIGGGVAGIRVAGRAVWHRITRRIRESQGTKNECLGSDPQSTT